MGADRRKLWKWVVGFLATIALLGALLVWQIARATSKTFERHAQEVSQQFSEYRARIREHVTLYSSEVAGNGWVPFRRAVDAFYSIPSGDLDLIPGMNDDTKIRSDPDTLDHMFSKYAHHVDELRQSFRMRTFVPGFAYESGTEEVFPTPTQSFRAVRYLSGNATRWHALGKDREALELLLIAFGIAQDSARGASLENLLAMEICEKDSEETWRTILEEHSLSAPDLEWCAGLLDRLSKGRSSMAQLLPLEGALERQNLLNWSRSGGAKSREGAGALEVSRQWRYAFSSRIAFADAMNATKHFYQDVLEVTSLPLRERMSAARSLELSLRTSKNIVCNWCGSAVSSMFKRAAIADRRWILMRTAIAIAWYKAEKENYPRTIEDLVPRYIASAPECPFTGKPLLRPEGKVLSIDDDGKGESDNPIYVQNGIEDELDLQWTVNRK